MIGRLTRRTAPDLAERLSALAEVSDVATGRLPDDIVSAAREVVARAGKRLAFSGDRTVAALAGGTGSGKSTLFNALVGQELSTTGVRRPTTSVTQACVWGAEPADDLLEWLGAGRRHLLGATDDSLDGLVLLDLPDHDSTASEHRLEVDRLVEMVDLLVWVLDPQKYADAAIHDGYLRALAGHAAVMVVVLNHADTLDANSLASCLADIDRLLDADGLHGVPVIATSARSGDGVAHLRRLLGERVAAKQAAAMRVSADVEAAATAFDAVCDPTVRIASVGDRAQGELVGALLGAAGGDVVVDAVVRDHRRQAAAMTGWPFTTWLRKLRPDPLKRLHLSPTTQVEASRTSLPEASDVQRARVSNAIAVAADSVTGGLPAPWPRLVRRTATAKESDLPDALDRAIAGTQLTSGRRPIWWLVVRLVQRALAAAAAAGAVWLLVLFAFGYLRLPEPPTPKVGEVPWPTLLLIGGIGAGWLVAVASRYVARAAAARRGRYARRQLEERITGVAQTMVIEPLMAEVSAYQAFCASLQRAHGT